MSLKNPKMALIPYIICLSLALFKFSVIALSYNKVFMFLTSCT